MQLNRNHLALFLRLLAPFPIEVTDEGIVISVNDKQSLNALSPIEVTDEGIAICGNL